MKLISQIYIQGVLLLIVAILINAVATKFGLPSWYDFLSQRQAKWYELIWLLIGYPFLLGVAMWGVELLSVKLGLFV